MADRVYPAAKPSGSNPPPKPLNGATFPAPKSQLYNPTRQPYRPAPKPRRRSKSCCHRCCICFIWFLIVLLALILLAAIAGGVVWVLYRPQRPTFSVTSLKISSFNLTSDTVTTSLALSLSARNPNKKLVFFYDPIYVDVSSNGVDLGNGTFPALVHGTKNSTTLKATVSSGGPRELEPDSANSLQSDLRKKKNRLPLEIRLETKVKVKLGSLKTKKVGIRVVCDGIDAGIPKGNSTAAVYTGSSSNPNCHVKLRIKIWKFQF